MDFGVSWTWVQIWTRPFMSALISDTYWTFQSLIDNALAQKHLLDHKEQKSIQTQLSIADLLKGNKGIPWNTHTLNRAQLYRIGKFTDSFYFSLDILLDSLIYDSCLKICISWIKKDLDKWKYISCLWMQKFNVVERTILHKLIWRVIQSLSKFQLIIFFLMYIVKLALKFT